MTAPKMKDLFSALSCDMQSSDEMQAYAERHGIRAAPHLTVDDDEIASLIVEHLTPRIEGKTIVEIGGGIGLLSLHMAAVAKRVFCIEANPMWSATFTELLLRRKPKNLSFLFGAADEFVGYIKGDIALVCTHSDVAGMKAIGSNFARTVIELYGEMIAANPGAFDPWARRARSMA